VIPVHLAGNPLVSAIEQVVLFLVVVGVAVAFHELGHFLAAKLLGVKVEVFSLGFGGRIWGRRIGDTDYRVSVIPLGGYVLMGGDVADEARAPDPRDFNARPLLFRLAIMLAGPIFSGLLTVLIMWGLFWHGFDVQAYGDEPARIGSVEKDSPAESAGLQAGDLVTSADGAPVTSWEKFSEIVGLSPKATLNLGIERGASHLDVPVTVASHGKSGEGWVGAEPCPRILIREVNAGSAAELAGLRPGDELDEVAGERLCSPGAMTKSLAVTKDQPVALTVLRDGATLPITVVPRASEDGAWRIGVGLAEATVLKRYGPAQAFVHALDDSRDKARLIAVAMGKLATGRLPFKSISSGIGMAEMAKETAEAGLVPFLQFIAFLSMNFAVFNLLPIPILDGGRITLLLLESVRGREFERRTKEWILQAGLVMIVVLMVAAIVLDIIKKAS
jgi:regulator of sigma E protease